MTEIVKIVRQAVQEAGILPFSEFMRLALYCPKYGYYEQTGGQIGRRGDFYTSVSVGPLFGELLAFQFAEWLKPISAGPFQLVEAGAHDGQLAADILGWFTEWRPEIVPFLQYWIIEPSARRQACQRSKLEKFAHHVRWAESLQALPPGGVRGIIFSNELLDSFPVHRLGWDVQAGRWFEWGVALNNSNASKAAFPGDFVWQRIPRPPDYLGDALRLAGLVPGDAAAVLPDGFTIEICPEAGDWLRQAASELQEGKLLTIDYGYEAEQFLTPERVGGTLRGYYRHHANLDLLAHVGEQDLTAHVNFTQLRRQGEEAGLRTEGFGSQEHFFTRILPQTLKPGSNFGEWRSARARQFQTLIHPQHLGRAFSVLVQAR